MFRLSRITILIGLVSMISMSAGLVLRSAQGTNDRGGNGQGDQHRDDPCVHLPDPPGLAKGIDKQCPPPGSSSGVAKGDFNHDGFADLAIGEPGATIGKAAGAGDVIVIYGSSTGLATTTGAVRSAQLWYEGPDRSLPGTPEAGDHFGTALASGDFDGDGFSDLAIGIPGKSRVIGGHTDAGAGAVMIIYGSANGLTSTDRTVPNPQYFDMNAFHSFNCPPPGARNLSCSLNVSDSGAGTALGQALAWGDFDGDAIGDLAIGLPGVANSLGAVWVIGGSHDGLNPVVFGSSLEFPGIVAPAKSAVINNDLDGLPGDRFGAALTAGDFDGNGLSDLAIGAPGHNLGIFVNGSCAMNCRAGAGKVGVSLNPTSGGLGVGGIDQIWTLDNTLGPAVGGEHFGTSLAAGNFNGDTRSDLAIGVPNQDIIGLTHAGSVILLYASAPGLTTTGMQQLTATSFGGGLLQSSAFFGQALAPGDFNGDGYVDLAIGVPGQTIAFTRNGVTQTLQGAGAVAVNYGSPNPLTVVVGRVFFSQETVGANRAQAGALFGSSLTAWNFGRNESICCLNGHPISVATADLAIGAPYKSFGSASGAGEVDVLYGSTTSQGNGLTLINPNFWTAGQAGFGTQAGAHFGAALY
jgi:hypothetical protein